MMTTMMEAIRMRTPDYHFFCPTSKVKTAEEFLLISKKLSNLDNLEIRLLAVFCGRATCKVECTPENLESEQWNWNNLQFFSVTEVLLKTTKPIKQVSRFVLHKSGPIGRKRSGNASNSGLRWGTINPPLRSQWRPARWNFADSHRVTDSSSEGKKEKGRKERHCNEGEE